MVVTFKTTRLLRLTSEIRIVNRACANVYMYVMRDPGEDDCALIQAARNGDRQAFALLYHRYKLDAWNLAYLSHSARLSPGRGQPSGDVRQGDGRTGLRG